MVQALVLLVVMSLAILVLAQSSDSKDLASGPDGIGSCLCNSDAAGKCAKCLKDETSLLQSLMKVEHHLKSPNKLSPDPPGGGDEPPPAYEPPPPAYPFPDAYEWKQIGEPETVHWQLQDNDEEAFVPWSVTAAPTVLIINDLDKFKQTRAPHLTHLMTNGLAGCFALSIYCERNTAAGGRRQGVFFAHVPGLEGAKGEALLQRAKSFVHDQGFQRVSVTLGAGEDTVNAHGAGFFDTTLNLLQNKLQLQSLNLVEWLPCTSASMGYDVQRFRMYPIGGQYATGQHRLLVSDEVAAQPAATEGVRGRRRQDVRLPLTWPPR